ncbi:2Fe-2S iron-sulfur cluster-binding protein [Variovorax sp. OV329]|uniref:2Fe-2S iron-sulfur cluster-binding protein n=1 Tax=Variovorax sp. OV329 TaxID=1882825 RepID=UPI0008E7160F|nr:2Fe-2S iron-sulfur cluster-binding protein [Variovorax sp. OV329]SFM05226.1 Ferredoxin [Variovorax sp. OV329]
MKIRIEPAGFEFEAAPGRTLLQAAEDAGLEIPASCRNGTCRTCLCRASGGAAVRYRVEWPGVSLDEKDEGWILPCVAEPLGDMTLHIPYALSLFD